MVTVYVDILIILNAFVNFFILLVTSSFMKENPKTLRVALSSFVGALFSLYIFLPSFSFILEATVRLLCSAVSVFVCFGKGSIIRFIRLTLVFYAVSFMYAGIMLGVWFILKPDSMAINNGIVYLDVSPLLLIIVTLVSYIVLTVVKMVSSKNGGGGESVGLKCKFDEKTISLSALVDTGHNIRDNLANSPVVIISRDKMKDLLGKDFDAFFEGNIAPDSFLFPRYRIIPCKTVGGNALLKAVRIDSMSVHRRDTVYKIDCPILAMSIASLGGDYDAIVGTDILQVTV
ncbi:MAG: sigma-E processing peptidase SpoIIGA [Clostridia bacterium]|nr:sigma-E processing peptidase SpoIIGA [Clostridia bacterium]